MADVEFPIEVEQASRTQGVGFGPSGGIPHATRGFVPSQFSVNGPDFDVRNIAGHARLGQGIGPLGQEPHLRGHVVAFYRALHLHDDRHHGGHHHPDDGDHAPKEEHGRDGRGDRLVFALEVHRLTSIRDTSSSNWRGAPAVSTVNPSMPEARCQGLMPTCCSRVPAARFSV